MFCESGPYYAHTIALDKPKSEPLHCGTMRGKASVTERRELSRVVASATLADMPSETKYPVFFSALRKSDSFDLLPISTAKRYRTGDLPSALMLIMTDPAVARALARQTEALTEEERRAIFDKLAAEAENRSELRRGVVRPKKGAKKK